MQGGGLGSRTPWVRAFLKLKYLTYEIPNKTEKSSFSFRFPDICVVEVFTNHVFLLSKCDNIINTQPHYYCFTGHQFRRCHLSVSRFFGMMRTPAKKETCSYSSGLESKERFRDQKSRGRRVLIIDENPARDDQLLETRFALTFLT